MKAVVNTRYGSPDVLESGRCRNPNRGRARSWSGSTRRPSLAPIRQRCAAHPFFVRFWTGLRRPRRTILGMDFAGEVETVGTGVTSFHPGDRVFGLSPGGYGAHAEYLCVFESGEIASLPADIGFDEAVVCEGALYANTYLEAFGLKPGQKILIYGASGAIGTAAVQLGEILRGRGDGGRRQHGTSTSSGPWAPTTWSTTPSRISLRSTRPSTTCSTPWGRPRTSRVGDC